MIETIKETELAHSWSKITYQSRPYYGLNTDPNNLM